MFYTNKKKYIAIECGKLAVVVGVIYYIVVGF